jgi:hypothetical protein
MKISNELVALENLSDDKGINRDWESFKENIKTSAKEVKVCMNSRNINQGLMRNFL